MELIALLFLWPFLILAFGLLFITFNDTLAGGFWLVLLGLFLVWIMISRNKNRQAAQKIEVTAAEELENLRQIIMTISISLLIPIFLRYLFVSFNKSLPVIILGLIIGFGLAIWGMFIKSNKVLMYSNIAGGTLAIIYVYLQLWNLGGLTRVVAAAFGLIVAVAVASIKFKDKLV